VILAGQAGVAGHLSIGDRALIGAKSAVWSSVEADTHALGYPAMNSYRYRRQVANVRRLPDLQKRLRDLEIEVEQLRKRLEPGE
jgi:UDP-3-O-[3-hydroxymyristoyl] glucosamine N-acyltransferase